MEYLPFGELLVEEHLNSYNSPFKFKAKEFDAETGNYYYGARYYNPKWVIWLSVDAEFAKFPSYSPYNYTLQNPINLVDPDGNAPIRPIPPINPIDIYNGIKAAGKYLNRLMVDGYNFVTSRGTNKNQRKDTDNKTKTINVDDIIAASPSSAKGINAKGSLVKKTVEGASDAIEEVNKIEKIVGNNINGEKNKIKSSESSIIVMMNDKDTIFLDEKRISRNPYPMTFTGERAKEKADSTKQKNEARMQTQKLYEKDWDNSN